MTAVCRVLTLDAAVFAFVVAARMSSLMVLFSRRKYVICVLLSAISACIVSMSADWGITSSKVSTPEMLSPSYVTRKTGQSSISAPSCMLVALYAGSTGDDAGVPSITTQSAVSIPVSPSCVQRMQTKSRRFDAAAPAISVISSRVPYGISYTHP